MVTASEEASLQEGTDGIRWDLLYDQQCASSVETNIAFSSNCIKHNTRCPYDDKPVQTESAGLLEATQLPGGVYHGNMLDRNVAGDDEGTDSVTSPRVGATRGAAMSHIIVPSGLPTQTPSLQHSAPGMPLSDYSPSLDSDTNYQHDTTHWSTFGLPATEFSGFPSTMPQSPWVIHSPFQQTPGLYTFFAAATHQQQNSGAGLYPKQDSNLVRPLS